ncbi:RNA polymerase, sigma-24 subunit, ECF subfamily protein [Paenibacillus vortex V453]|jgi:RNA polymerase sigma factor (sigma-70 family)|uniref:RNA polymerase subunit sigma-24 n=2 Tax=Paenibacillus TaxID=44249 RepID=A0A163DDZ7_9BACL|nr:MULTISPECIES: sigma-70 family RNA polymerase sigma factor [Paenibacillus]MCA4756094.1 sigma-70 family RNA polymerase sigma factor [Mycolicibacterium fortuitum]AVV58230.1 RNA polymerase subunit sigma-24 [Paenibacillus glucanolyticus]AWP27393.1 RNA polymerase subunit sigma-24 [Paenibacillus sp. Cedars]EFU40858.1 RNA polymerase, sigma-24 subunit, ECF subfamily protein [Paenibacillus vortex V453]ETT42989.1 ECF subfamily RNA polymerase sigma-24 factor [Paenibacillus sp. FSL R5-808]
MNVSRLVRQAQRGNKEALLQLILAEQDAYYRLAYSYMGNEYDAMDAMEDMIVTLYEKLEQLKKGEAFYSWSKTILVNRCKTLLRKKERFLPLGDEQESVLTALIEDNPYRLTESELNMQELLSHLNPRQREAIELRYVHDLPYQAIADITGTPIGTIKSRISQGILKLKAMIGGDRYEDDRGEIRGAQAGHEYDAGTAGT